MKELSLYPSIILSLIIGLILLLGNEAFQQDILWTAFGITFITVSVILNLIQAISNKHTQKGD